MKFGVAIPTCREGLMYPPGFASPESNIELALKAEELGFDSVWGNDHITTQKYLKDLKPKPNFYEPLIIFSHLVALTRRILFGTGVIVAPLRDVLILAKQAVTLDHLSNGRFILGLGIGAYREEFVASGRTGNRGEILEETIKALRELFEKPIASFSGKYINFTEIELNPKPIRKCLPIYVGGNAPQTLRRVGMLADGWLPASLKVEELKWGKEKILEYAKAAGRDMKKIEVAPEFACSISKDRNQARKKFKSSPMFEHIRSLARSTFKDVGKLNLEEQIERNFIGSPSEILKKLILYEEAGVDHIWFDFIGQTPKEVTQAMEIFSSEVLPSFK
jgi:probable F420-dependent oxidoreductase